MQLVIMRVDCPYRLRREGQQSPTSSLFIVGFDHRRTPTSLLTSIFSPFGPLDYVELKNNYAFVKVLSPYFLVGHTYVSVSTLYNVVYRSW